jgi:hypothetical protein
MLALRSQVWTKLLHEVLRPHSLGSACDLFRSRFSRAYTCPSTNMPTAPLQLRLPQRAKSGRVGGPGVSQKRPTLEAIASFHAGSEKARALGSREAAAEQLPHPTPPPQPPQQANTRLAGDPGQGSAPGVRDRLVVVLAFWSNICFSQKAAELS